MKKKTWCLCSVLFVMLLMLSACDRLGGEEYIIPTATPKQETVLTGWQEIEGERYLYGEDGTLPLGWVEYQGKTYYQTSEGIVCDKQTIDGEVYYFQEDGSFLTGLVEEDGVKYCYNAYGTTELGFVEVSDKTYFCGADGKVRTGWLEYDYEKYYFDEVDASMRTGLLTLGQAVYFMDETGKMQTGFQTMEDGTRFFGNEGTMHRGWLGLDGKRYFMDDEGLLVTGWREIASKKYYFDDEGVAWTGWMVIDDVYYYFRGDGQMAVGEHTIEGVKYCFADDGHLRNGWEDKVYYVNGYKANGVVTIDKKLYLFRTDGTLASNGFSTVGGRKYYVVKNGELATGFLTLESKTYYFDAKGRMATGITKIGGKKYYFYADGTLARNVKVDNYFVDENGVATDLFETITADNLDAYIEHLLDKHGDSILDIYNYVRDNYPYRYRDKADLTTMACRMLNYGNGACWDYAALTYKMLTAAGYNCQIVIGKGAVYSEHNWILIEVEPGVWRHLDTERKSLRVFLWTDEQLKAKNWITKNVRYEWDYDAYPKAE